MQANDLIVSTTGADAAGAFAILAVIADPEAARARLEELRAERIATEAALAETRALNDAMVNGREVVAREAQEARELAQANAGEAERLEAVATELATREAALTVAQGRFDQAIIDRGAEWDRREQAVLAREVAAEAREKRITALETDLATREADYQRKVGRLRELAG